MSASQANSKPVEGQKAHDEGCKCPKQQDLLDSYNRLLDGNKVYHEKCIAEDPNYFVKHAEGQSPQYLWIGCADSRVPANEVTNTLAGDMFVHRNIANVVVHTDTNLLSVLYYAIEVLKVKHVIVCGHYGCGGVAAAMANTDLGFINNWLRHIKEVRSKHIKELTAIEDENKRARRLVELNVIEQVQNLAKTRIVQNAWKNHGVQLHGWVYGLEDGHITELDTMVDDVSKLAPEWRYDL